MMLSHISIGVKDLSRSRRFYDAVLKALGYKCLLEGSEYLGYGSAPLHCCLLSDLLLEPCWVRTHRTRTTALDAVSGKLELS